MFDKVLDFSLACNITNVKIVENNFQNCFQNRDKVAQCLKIEAGHLGLKKIRFLMKTSRAMVQVDTLNRHTQISNRAKMFERCSRTLIEKNNLTLEKLLFERKHQTFFDKMMLFKNPHC